MYTKFQKFECSGTDVPNVKADSFIQHVADNVHIYKTCTLDGHDAFHGMGTVTATEDITAVSHVDIKLMDWSQMCM
jgi:hypothetical protein